MFERKASPVEVYNDYDGSLVNLSRLLQNSDRFAARLSRTLHSPEECRRAIKLLVDGSEEDRAWALYVMQSSAEIAPQGKRWGRSSKVSSAQQDALRTDRLSLWWDRITRVQIDHRTPEDAIKYWDDDDTTMCVVVPPLYPFGDALLYLSRSKSRVVIIDHSSNTFPNFHEIQSGVYANDLAYEESRRVVPNLP